MTPRESGRVFYKDVHSSKEIPTDFTKAHIDIAWHDFPQHDAAHINLDKMNSDYSDGKFDVYTAKGR